MCAVIEVLLRSLIAECLQRAGEGAASGGGGGSGQEILTEGAVLQSLFSISRNGTLAGGGEGMRAMSKAATVACALPLPVSGPERRLCKPEPVVLQFLGSAVQEQLHEVLAADWRCLLEEDCRVVSAAAVDVKDRVSKMLALLRIAHMNLNAVRVEESEGEAMPRFTGIQLNKLSLRALKRDGWQIHYQKPYTTVTREAELKPAKKCKWLMVAAREISSDTLMMAAMAPPALVRVLLSSLSLLSLSLSVYLCLSLFLSLSFHEDRFCLSIVVAMCAYTYVCIYLYACTHTCIQTGTQAYLQFYRSAPGEWSALLLAPWKLLRVL